MKKKILSLLLMSVVLLSMLPAAYASGIELYEKPAAPEIAVTPDFVCAVDDYKEMHVRAYAPDGGELSYQWCYGYGLDAEPIFGETGETFIVDTSTAGVYIYSCEVTNSRGGETTSRFSDPVTVKVEDFSIAYIEVYTLPTKLKYEVGDRLSLSGLSIRVVYNIGTHEIIEERFGVEPMLLTESGTQPVTVSYQGLTCSFDVTVGVDKSKVDGIGIVTLPNKVKYKLGDRLDTRGLTVRAYTTDNKRFDVEAEELECSPTVLKKAGEQPVTVSYLDKTCTFTVTVEDDSALKSISVSTLPITRDYTVGDRLDTTGLVVVMNSPEGSSVITSGYACTPKVLTEAGTQTINVIYGQYSCSFTVNVKEKTVSPTPAPTVKPVQTEKPTELPTATVTHTQRPTSQDNGGISPVVKVIFVFALAALAGLTAFVFIMQKRK